MIRRMRRVGGTVVRSMSERAVHAVVNRSPALRRMWDISLKKYPSFRDHFAKPVDDPDTEARIRFLVAAECAFVEDEIKAVLAKNSRCTYADIGDSDGSVRVVMHEIFGRDRLSTTGINLQPTVVKRMQEMGLDAICEDAVEVGKRGVRYNVVSVFETLEHLPDPIGFLKAIGAVVEDRLVLSVPYVRRSRVGLQYLDGSWPAGEAPTIENVHVFELCPADLRKLFQHAGWRVERESIFKQFPASSPAGMLLSIYWRLTSFEGFYFASLVKDDTYASRYKIE